MIKKILLLPILFLPFQAFGEVIKARDCKFFRELTAGYDWNSTDLGAFGKPFDISRLRRLSVLISWNDLTTYTEKDWAAFPYLDAVVKVQVSNTPSNWIDIPGATFRIMSSDGIDYIKIRDLSAHWARVVYTHNTVSNGKISGYCHAE
jgi:hypothetical protein